MADKQTLCDLCEKGFPIKDGKHYGTQALGMIPTTRCEQSSQEVQVDAEKDPSISPATVTKDKTLSAAPERIWIDNALPDVERYLYPAPCPEEIAWAIKSTTEYVRADVARSLPAETETALRRAIREGRHGPMCDRARCMCWKAEARNALASARSPLPGDTPPNSEEK